MNKKYILLCFLICAAGILLVTEAASAVNYDQKIKETEQEKKTLERKAEQLQKDLEDIQASRDDTMVYIEKLDKKTGELEEELVVLKGQIKEAKASVEKLQSELSQAEAERQKQYTTMKMRIKYMYENGNQKSFLVQRVLRIF